MKNFMPAVSISSKLIFISILLFPLSASFGQECPGEYFYIEPGGCVLCEEGFTLENLEGTDCYRCVRESVSSIPERCGDPIPTAATVHLTIKTNGDDDNNAIPLQLDGPAIIERIPQTASGEVQTEMVSLSLTSSGPIPIKVRAGRNFGLPPSTGRITPITPNKEFPKSSSFDVFIDIEIRGLPLVNSEPIRIKSTISESANKTKYHLDKSNKCDCRLYGEGFEIEIKQFSLELDKNIAKPNSDRKLNPRSIVHDIDPQSLKIYPNPFSGFTTVDFVLLEDGLTILNIIGLDGRKMNNVYSGHTISGQVKSIRLDTENINPGMYILQLRNGKTVIENKRIVIMK